MFLTTRELSVMKMCLGILVFIVILCSLSTSVFAVGKTTVDPNASGKVDEKQVDTDFWSSDSRLNQKITFSVKNKQVRLILDDLSELTGISLKAGYNVKDWQVRDRRMSIFARDIPLSDVMKSVARVMKFKWSKSDAANVPTYRLIMDRKQILSAESLRQNSLSRYTNELKKRREQSLVELEKVAALPRDELENIRSKQPTMYLYTTLGEAKFLTTLARECPSARDAILAGDELILRASTLPESVQSTLLGAMGGHWGLMCLGTDDSKAPLPANCKDNIANSIIQINESKTPNNSSLSFMNMISISCDEIRFNVFLPNPNDALQDAYCVGTLQALEDNVVCEKMWARPEYKASFEAGHVKSDADTENFCPGEPGIEHIDEPWTHTKLKTIAKGKLFDIQESLAECSGFSVVSDCFGGSSFDGESFDFAKDTELAAILDKIAKDRKYNWQKNGSVIEFQDRKWFIRRCAQIPDEQIDGWVSRLKKSSILDLDDLSQIAQLTGEQFDENIYPNDTLGNPELLSQLEKAMASSSLLRVYNTLSSAQRTALLAGMDATSQEFSDQQWQLTFRALRNKDPKVITNSDSGLVLNCKPIAAGDGITEYWFKMACVGQEKSIYTQWCVRTPKYVEPVKGKPGK